MLPNRWLMKKGILFIIFPLFSQLITAQEPEQGIQGEVRDGVTLKNLEFVNFIIPGTKFGASSKPDGSFKISGIPAGKYKLQASRVGYKSISRTVSVSKGSFTKIQIDLIPAVISIDSVSVVGRRRHNYISVPTLEPLALNPVISKINRLEFERQGATTLVEAMKFVPGAVTETRGRKVKQFFSVRGQKYPYPEYAINGTWLREFHEMPYFISANNIEEIEIIRSSAALITGLSGLAGVVNFKTREYHRRETSAELEYGTFNTLHSNLSHGSKHEKFSYAAGIGYDKTNGPVDKNADEKIGNFYGRFDWRPSGKLSIGTNIFFMDGRRELALAEEPAGRRFREEISSYDQVRSTLVNLKVNYRPNDNASTEVQLYYADRQPVFRRQDINTQEIFVSFENDHEFGFNVLQALKLSERNTLRFGGLYNHWIAPNGKRFYAGRRCDLETVSGVLADEHSFGTFTLDAAVRWTRIYMNEYGAFNINGRGGAFRNVDPIVDEWQPDNIQAALGFTWNLSENWSVFFHSATGQIKPREGSLDENIEEPQNETRTKFDLGIQTELKRNGKITLTGFYVNQNKAIFYSGNTYEVNGIIMELYKNRDADNFGLEAAIIIPTLWDHFSGFLNFTAIRSRVEEDGQMEINREFPEIIANGGIIYTKSRFDVNIYWKYVSKFKSSRFVSQVPGEPTIYAPLGEYFISDMTTGYTMGSNLATRIYLKIQNLTNKKYSTVAGYPDFGRRLNVGIRITF